MHNSQDLLDETFPLKPKSQMWDNSSPKESPHR